MDLMCLDVKLRQVKTVNVYHIFGLLSMQSGWVPGWVQLAADGGTPMNMGLSALVLAEGVSVRQQK